MGIGHWLTRTIKTSVCGYRAYSDTYIKELRSKGAVIGEDVTIHYPMRTVIDATAPHLITIGNHVNITGPATILTHDYSWSVVKGKTGEILGNQKPVVIGDNVFIGWGATILCGSIIEDNVVVGAHAVVSGLVDHDSVWGGVPARRICSLEHYRKKRLTAQIAEGKMYVHCFRERYGRDPRKDEIPEYFMLFCGDEELEGKLAFQVNLMGTEEKTKRLMREAERPYRDYNSFIKDC